MKSAKDMAKQCKEIDPGKWGHAKDKAVGYYFKGQWHVYAILTTTSWTVAPDIPKVNGTAVYQHSDWIEI